MPEPKETVLASTDVPADAEQDQKVCPSVEKRAGPNSNSSCEESVIVDEKKDQLQSSSGQVDKPAENDAGSSQGRIDSGPRFE